KINLQAINNSIVFYVQCLQHRPKIKQADNCPAKKILPLITGGKIKKEKNIIPSFYFNIGCQFFIYQYSSAVFAHHYFFVLFDLALFLGRNSIKTSATRISFNSYNGQSI